LPATLAKMWRFAWSFHTTGIIEANPESVLAWWFAPERIDEDKSDLEAIGALDLSIEDSTIVGVEVRTTRWRDERDWEHIHHVPIHNRLPERKGDRFVLDSSDSTELKHPTGEKMTVKCNAQVVFVSLGTKSTEVSVVHNHLLRGGRLRRRWTFPQSQQGTTEIVFEQMMKRCRSALEVPSDPSSG
jgi:hypothetical protein